MERARSSNPISKQTALLVQSKKAFSKVDDIKTVKKSMTKKEFSRQSKKKVTYEGNPIRLS